MACGCGKRNKTIITTTGQAEALASYPQGTDKYAVDYGDNQTEKFTSYVDASIFRRTNGGKIRAL